MRFLVGLIVGVLLTIGAAYVHDSWVAGPDTQDRRMVNWDVVQRSFHELGSELKAEWNKLTGHPRG
jgi:hypothetical protein